MGRYYSGDIKGKFWFGVQNSDDGEFFGAQPQEPSSIPYYADDLQRAEEGVRKCEKELGTDLQRLETFFSDPDVAGYNDKIIADYWHDTFGITIPTEPFGAAKKSVKLEWYARLILGRKIVKCIKEKGYCSFNAEL